MRCQYCGYLDSKVIDSRPTEEGSAIRRRRECLRCGRRFTTYEKIETSPIMVVKKDMRREPFNASKMKEGLIHACQKRPISMKDIDNIVEKVEKQVYAAGEDEISSRRIGEAVMAELKRAGRGGLCALRVRVPAVYRCFQLHGRAEQAGSGKQGPSGKRISFAPRSFPSAGRQTVEKPLIDRPRPRTALRWFAGRMLRHKA